MLTLATGDRIPADQVVLALGHQAPGAPGTLNQRSAVDLIGAWDFEAMHQLPSDQAVLILGTGHTAVDTLFCLAGSMRRAPVYLLSRRGLLPREHRKSPTAPTPQGFPSYLAGVKPAVRAYLSAFRGHLTDRAARGGNWRDAMNELRPHSPQIWQSLEVAERRRLLTPTEN